MPNHNDNDNTTNGMQCHDFDGLLSDAIDGILTGEKLAEFQAHARSCAACGPLLAEAEAGRNWLKGLMEVEPPASLVTKILASTTGVDTQRLRVNVATPRITLWERAQAWASGAMQPFWATMRQPRFAMSFGMAFFSVSVALSVLGFKPADLRQISLRPTAIRHTFYNTQARVVRYYENIRFVYEVESRVRELKRNVTPAEPAPVKQKDKNDTTEKPEQKQDFNYSQNPDQWIMASGGLVGGEVTGRGQECPRHTRHMEDSIETFANDLPVVPVTTYRRFV
jgi:hypothetical protein